MPREPCWACKVGEYDDCECPPDCDCEVCTAYKELKQDRLITKDPNKAAKRPPTMILKTTTGFSYVIYRIDFPPQSLYANVLYKSGERGSIEICMIASIRGD